MADLTPAQLTRIRQETGDTVQDNDGDYWVSNEDLEAIFDDSAQGAGDLDLTIYYTLRRLRGIFSRLYASTSDQSTEQKQQRYEHVREMLAEYEARVGLRGGSLTTGFIGLGLDYTEDDLIAGL